MKKILIPIVLALMICASFFLTGCLEEEHTLQYHAAKEATCTEEGNTEYWECTDCGKYYSDENAENEITDKSSVIIPKKAHSWAETILRIPTYSHGGSVFKTCTVCGETVTEETDPLSYTADITVRSGESISAAVEKAENGDFIVVEEGTYAEQLFISGKEITLIGKGNVVVTGPENYSDMIAIDKTANESAGYSAILAIENSDVTIENITVKGDIEKVSSTSAITHNTRYAGVAAINSDVVMNYVAIKDITFTKPLIGIQNGFGIYAVAADKDKSLTVRYGEISNFCKCAAVIRNSISNFTFDGNVVSGMGPQGLIAQNGIQLDCAATVINNTVSDLSYAPEPANEWAYGSVAIYVLTKDKSVTVMNNTVKNCDNGILGYESSTTVSGNVFENMTEEEGCFNEYLEPAEESMGFASLLKKPHRFTKAVK